jgi:hypothetical protein
VPRPVCTIDGMTTTEAIPTEAVVDTYFASWNEADRARRLQLIADSWTDAAHYVDPLNDVSGHDGIADMMEGVRAQFPGATLQRTGAIDLHHDVARFPWSATGTDGALIVQGIDVVVIAPDGKLSALAGFFDH